MCVCVFVSLGLQVWWHAGMASALEPSAVQSSWTPVSDWAGSTEQELARNTHWSHFQVSAQNFTCPAFAFSLCPLILVIFFFPPLHFLCICIFNFSCQLQQLLTFPLTSQFSPLVISTVFSTSLSLPLSSKRVISINVDLRVNRGIFLILFLLTGRAAYSSRHHLRRCVHAILEKWSVSSRSQTSSEGSAPRGRSSSSTSWLTGMRLGSSQFSARPRTSLVAWKLCNTSSRCFDFYNYSENDLLLSFL